MSINRLFADNGYILYCDEMHCNNVVPPLPGNQGDLYTVNDANQSVFSKTIEGTGPSDPLQFINCPVQILSTDPANPSTLSVGADHTHNIHGLFTLGNLTTNDSFFFDYDDHFKSLTLTQNNAAVNGNYNINLYNGSTNHYSAVHLQNKLIDYHSSSGSSRQFLSSNINNVSWADVTSPVSDYTYYVNKSGNDTSGDGSINNPFLTCSAAMNAITNALPTQRVIINLGSGRYSENFSFKANVFIVGYEPLSTRLDGIIDINNPSWNNGDDNRCGISNCSILNPITFDFTLQSSTAGKVYIYNCWFDDLVTSIAFYSINQFLVFDSVFFGGWTQTGIESIISACNFFGGDINVNDSVNSDTSLTLSSTVGAGNLIVSSSVRSLEVDLYSSYMPSISVSGSFSLLKYTLDSVPISGITLSGGATSTNLNQTFNTNLVSSYVQNVPGVYNIVCPASAKSCTISAVGGGGGGCNNPGFASPGGGGAGGVLNYPVSVGAEQFINITIGAGGASNNDGNDTVINIGTLVITCGKGFTSTDQTHGGNGGSVNLGFTSISGGAGGNADASGSNGNINFFMYSGAGGGGSRANGGSVLLFSGGSADANYGGGGASLFANGGNNHSNGTFGSGGGADNFSGGDGYVYINFYS